MNKQITFPVIEVLFGIAVEIKRKRGEEYKGLSGWSQQFFILTMLFVQGLQGRTTNAKGHFMFSTPEYRRSR